MFVSPEPKIENETVRENQSAFHIKKVARIFSKGVQQHMVRSKRLARQILTMNRLTNTRMG